ncbi:hypothetical protein [Psychroserpens algicola]|uniref:Uncharacterized protein n=1 Tax=Psychroserpens algicola TaxID=1719034 RepID=A0ABT0H980_9FLAO|nr:hypothetical protein [Psychroserpens algicola]MCK8480929.1 hypothetical protein [Psychroserpens algicola]
MDHHIIKQIVKEVFEKAKGGSPSHTPTALSNYIDDQTDNEIKARTARRAHKRYIKNDNNTGAPIPETVNNFCKFLGYEDYKDYVEKNIINELEDEEPKTKKKSDKTEIDTYESKQEEKGRKKRKWILTLKITVAFALTVTLYQLVIPTIWKNKNDDKPPIECMAWAEDHYEKIDCDLQLHPKYGTQVTPYVASLEKSMQKLDNDSISASTTFFSEETGKPLVWYYKTKEGTLEYYTAPGLHPVNGETLKKITEGMIEKYVPIHKTQPNSFISDDNVNSIKTEIAILILNENNYDDALASNLMSYYYNKNNSVIRLRDSIIYQESFISNFNPDIKLYSNDKLISSDTLVLGTSKYHFSNNIDIQNMVICNLTLDFSIYAFSNNKWKEVSSKMINSIGSGYTNTEAKTNTINKMNYE